MLVAIIQARMSSSRLPGKVLLDLGGKPILQWAVDAAKNSSLVDEVMIATSDDATDIPIIEYCESKYIDYYVGNLHDVLDRYYNAAIVSEASHIARITADCPFQTSQMIDGAISYHLSGGYDYTCNFGYKTYVEDGKVIDTRMPGIEGIEGMAVEVFSFDTLLRSAKLASIPYDREHVTPFMRRGLFYIGKYLDYIPDDSNLSIDTKEDYERLKDVAEGFTYAACPSFDDADASIFKGRAGH